LESPAIITKIKIYQKKTSGTKLWYDINDYNGDLLERRDWDVEDKVQRYEFNYHPPVTGQIVRISGKGMAYLSFSEVEVYGKYPPQPTPSPTLSSFLIHVVKNLSWRKPTWQTSTNNEQTSDHAVDGEIDTYSYTKRGYNAWEEDLESPAIITKIKFSNGGLKTDYGLTLEILMIIF